MPKAYFREYDEDCYSIESHIAYMRENGIETMTVFEAAIERDSGYFYCKHFFEVGEKGNCGRICEAYAPRNGKSGICKHTGHVYEITGKSKTITLP